MANYDAPTGTSGTLRMVINQSGPNFSVTFQIINTSGPTFINNLGWSGSVGGTPVGGSVNINGAGTYTLGSWNITQYGSVPFSLSIGATGTSGLGGPATSAVTLNGGSSSSAPGGVPTFRPDSDERTTTQLGFTWGAAPANGSTINGYQIQMATDPSFNDEVGAPLFSSNARSAILTLLSQNTIYHSRIRARNGVGWGPWSGALVNTTQPVANNPLAVIDTTPQTVSLEWPYAGGNGGLSTFQYQISDQAQAGLGDFTGSPITAESGTARQVLVGGLVPGEQYWAHVRSRNGQGVWGIWSNVITFTLDAATAPGLTVTPNLNGMSATLAATPPPGVTVTSYRAQYRPVGAATSTDVNFTGTTTTVNNLLPGQAYQWRLAAFFPGGSSPYSDWITVIQPSTNTNPGDYFDGATPAKEDTTYGWTGAADASTSFASAFAPRGWRTFAQSSGVSGGSGVVASVTGGRQGERAARVTFFSDTTAPGYQGGTGLQPTDTFDVEDGGTYVGSIHVQPSRSQRMAAQISWINASGARFAYATGTAEVVGFDSPMTRLSVRGLAPAGAVRGSVGWVDVAGEGWSAWLGGETVLQDDAMSTVGQLLPFFSGDTPDTGQFAYSWLGLANASISERTTLDVSLVDPLADPDCPPIPTPPTPPTVDDPCIEETGQWRRYWAIIGEQEISEWLDVVPTLTITTGAVPARQVRIRFWENPDGMLPDQFQQTEGWDSEQIISYIPPNTTLTLDGVANRVWASVAGGPSLNADKLLYGTGGTPATWPVLSCGMGYLISFDVPLDAPDGNIDVSVALTRRM